VFKSKQPSLRNFAVLERLERNRFGSIYSVQDRRTDQSNNLFVPNRTVAWPRYLDVFREADVSLVRLRDGRVAFSIASSVGVKELAKVARFKTNTFDALAGFGLVSRKPKRNYASILLVLVSLCVGGVVWQGSAAATSQEPKSHLKSPSVKIVPACSNDALVGELFTWINGKHEILVMGMRLKLSGQQQLGGYLQLTLTSQCDHKRFHLSAWLEGKQYRITSVN